MNYPYVFIFILSTSFVLDLPEIVWRITAHSSWLLSFLSFVGITDPGWMRPSLFLKLSFLIIISTACLNPDVISFLYYSDHFFIVPGTISLEIVWSFTYSVHLRESFFWNGFVCLCGIISYFAFLSYDCLYCFWWQHFWITVVVMCLGAGEVENNIAEKMWIYFKYIG